MIRSTKTHVIVIAMLVVTGLFVSFAAAQELPDESKLAPLGIVAEVNGDPILGSELDARVPIERERLESLGVPAAYLAEHPEFVARGALDWLIIDRLLLQRCDEEKIVVTDEEVEELILRQLRSEGRSATLKDFFSAIEARFGENETALRKRLRDQRRMEELQRKLAQSRYPFISPTEMRAYYLAHRDVFTAEATYRYRHLFVSKGDPDLPAIREHIEKELSAGASFEELVRKYSQGMNAEEGGLYELTDTELDKRVLKVAETIRKLKQGEASGLVSTPQGIHYFYLESRKPGEALPFEEAMPRIRDIIYRNRMILQEQRFEKELRDRAFIQEFIALPKRSQED